ncbi:hypothetical protein [Acidaminococcus provencensis]|uniref:hypothetical protein n=1 Tax=Acidaminococcus provencensis TaxID=2058289 RepID=UPI000CF9CA49|nr:hypothetical protein [Acidaminococcus provencensis]
MNRKVKFLLLVIVVLVFPPSLIVFLLWKLFHKNSRNNEIYGGYAIPSDEIMKKRRPYLNQAKSFGFFELRKMRDLSNVPDDVLQRWASRAVEDLGRNAITANDVIPFFSGITKKDAGYLAASIKSTCRSYWDQVEAQRVGARFYLWSSLKGEQHFHLDNLVVPVGVPLPPNLTKDTHMNGPIFPGEGFRCLCYAEPIIDADQLKRTVKVYEKGMIISMPKREFLRTHKI